MNLRKFENYPNSLYAFANNHSNMLKDENKIYMFFKEYVIDILFYSQFRHNILILRCSFAVFLFALLE